MEEAYTGYSVEVIIYEVTIPAGKSYNEACEYDLTDEYPLVAFTDYEEARDYAEALNKVLTVYESNAT